MVEGPVGTRWLRQSPVFRYENRCWRDGVLSNLAHRPLDAHHPALGWKVARWVLAARGADPDVAALVERGMQRWDDGCRDIARRLGDEGRLAEPWTIDSAADLLWSLMFPETLERLTGQRGWSTEQYGEGLAVLLLRTLVAETPGRRG